MRGGDGPGRAVVRRLLPASIALLAVLGYLRWEGERQGLYGAANDVSELGAAVDRGEAPAVARVAHKLKGSSATLGATRASQIASELETTAQAGDLTAAGDLLEELRRALDETRTAFRDRAASVQSGSS